MRHIKLTQLLIKKTKIYQIYSSIAPIKNRKLKCFKSLKNQKFNYMNKKNSFISKEKIIKTILILK